MRSTSPRSIAVAVLSMLAGATTLRAQNETLFSGGSGSVGFYVAPVVKLTELAGRSEVMGGARAGVLFGRRFAVGVAAYRGGGGDRGPIVYARNPGFPPNDAIPGGPRDFRHAGGLTYGGLELEYVALPQKLVHASVSSLLGGGTFGWPGMNVASLDAGLRPRGYHDGRSFFVAEPAANAELNLASHVRLALGVGYRFVAGGNNDGWGNGAGGVTGSLGLKLGKL